MTNFYRFSYWREFCFTYVRTVWCVKYSYERTWKWIIVAVVVELDSTYYWNEMSNRYASCSFSYSWYEKKKMIEILLRNLILISSYNMSVYLTDPVQDKSSQKQKHFHTVFLSNDYYNTFNIINKSILWIMKRYKNLYSSAVKNSVKKDNKDDNKKWNWNFDFIF